MHRDKRYDKAEALLDPKAVQDVSADTSISISPTPADLDTVAMSFESEAYRYASAWLTAHPDKVTKANPFALVYSRSITQDKELLAGIQDVQRYHAFRSQQMVDVTGRIVVTTQNFEDALTFPVSEVRSSQDLFNQIEKLGFKDRLAVAFEPPKANLVLLRRGLSGGSRSMKVAASGTEQPWRLEDLEKEIDQFHSDQTRTPSGILVPWFDAGNGITGDKLEIRISKALAHQLDLIWRKGTVLSELGCPSGRMDVFIPKEVLTEGNGPCVIEVKVLRSRHRRLEKGRPRIVSDESVVGWAEKGVIQADLYRKDKSAPSAYLCSFDARDKDISLPTVDKLAKSRKIEHRKYFMFRSSEDLHASELNKAKA